MTISDWYETSVVTPTQTNAAQIITDVLRLCYQAAGDYSRYAQADILAAVNEAVEEITTEAGMLQGFGIIQLVADRRLYPLPSNCFRLKKAWYVGSDNLKLNVEIITEPEANDQMIGTPYLTNTGIPNMAYISDSSGFAALLGVYPIPTETGTALTFAAGTGVTASSNLQRIAQDLTGTHNGAGSNASLIDTTTNFQVAGVVVGSVVFNTTDGSYGIVTAMSTTTNDYDTLAMTLTGGTDNDWDASDAYKIAGGDYGVIIKSTGAEQYLYSLAQGPITDLTVPAKNLMILYDRFPYTLNSSGEYTEVSRHLQKAIRYYAAGILLETEPPGSKMRQQGAEYMAKWQGFVGKAINYKVVNQARRKSGVIAMGWK